MVMATSIFLLVACLCGTHSSSQEDTERKCVLHPGTLNAPQDLTVVPAMWVHDYPAQPWHSGFQTCVYQRKNESLRGYVSNKAYEAGVYLRFIIDHYNKLPAISVFVQEDALEDIGARVAHLRRDVDWSP